MTALPGRADGTDPLVLWAPDPTAAERSHLERFRRHVENEHHMLDVLLPVMQPDQRRDLARAMVEATLSEGEEQLDSSGRGA